MLIGLSVIGFLQQHGETIELQIIRQNAGIWTFGFIQGVFFTGPP